MQESVSVSSAGRRRGADPVVRWLIIAIIGVVIFWLVGLLSAIFFGVVAPPKIARTEAEHNLSVLSAKVQAGNVTAKVYAQYIDALINAGQLSKAQSAIDQSLKTAKSGKSYLMAEQAQLALARKDYKGTVEAADLAMAQAQKELKAFMDKNVAANRKEGAGAVMPTSYSTAALDKAFALRMSKDYKGEIKALDAYLKLNQTDSDILVMRAEAKINVGDKKGAAADYRTALTFIPDYQPAIDGLKKIGASR